MSNIVQLHAKLLPEDLALTCEQCGGDKFYLLATSDIQCAECDSTDDGLIWGFKNADELPPVA